MADSKLFQDYRRAFASVCGLVLELRNPDWSVLTKGIKLISGKQRRGGQPFRGKPAKATHRSTLNRQPPADRCATFVPVRTGNHVIALLELQPIPLRFPTSEEVARVFQIIGFTGGRDEIVEMEASLRQARYITPPRYASMMQLLELFARQLGEWFVLCAPTKRSRESLTIIRAKEWIKAHHHERVTLTKAAKSGQVSSWHLSRIFHAATGMTFRAYLAHIRMDHVRTLLADPYYTIADAAFAVGFQSISQFNRVFLKLAGQSPSEYRAALPFRMSTPLGVAIAKQVPATSQLPANR